MAGYDIAAIGINRRTHSYAHVERVKRAEDAVHRSLKEIAGEDREAGYLVLDTCSRYEVYIAAPADRLQSHASEVGKAMASASGADPKVYRGFSLLDHLFRVLVGSESPAPFEADLVAQARRAVQGMQLSGRGGRTLYRVFRAAIELSLEARSSLGVDGSIGIPELSVMAAERALGSLRSVGITVIGTGEVGRRIAAALKSRGAYRVAIVGRSHERAEPLAKLFPGGRAYGLQEVRRAIGESELVFAAISSREPLIRAEDLEGFSGLLVDLSMPRAVDPGAAVSLGKGYMWLEDLEEVSGEVLAELHTRLRALDEVAYDYVARLYGMIAVDRLREELGEFARLYEANRRREVERAVGELGLGEREREVLELVTRSIMDKALGALWSLVDGGGRGWRA